MADICKGRAVSGEHFWGTPESYSAMGIEVEIAHCTSCGKRKLRARWRYILPKPGASEWKEMVQSNPEDKGESSERQKQEQA